MERRGTILEGGILGEWDEEKIAVVLVVAAALFCCHLGYMEWMMVGAFGIGRRSSV